MRSLECGRNATARRQWPAALLVLLLATATSLEAMGTRQGKLAIVPKWGRFEQTFTSSILYSNALQEATLAVEFTSPLGESFRVYGFWDGDKTWRVRFSPNQPGTWTFTTACSDSANQGLHHQAGKFLCTSVTGLTRFEQHGPVQVAADHRHFEHADGTAFFWLADTAWNGAQVSALKDWQRYAGIRGSQRFTVVQWSAAPGANHLQAEAYSGFPDCIAINPEYFKQLDAKLETMNRVGILNAIAPLAELASSIQGETPTEDQAALLVRYVVARYQGDPVVWLLALDGETAGKAVGRWKRIGQTVFAGGPHAPVILYPGEANWLFDEFRDQPWIDAFACRAVSDMSDDGLKFAFAGPLPKQWTNGPARPLIAVTPPENGIDIPAKRRFSADDVRHAAWWGLLLAPPAGVSYSAQGVVNWDTTVTLQTNKIKGANLPLWQKSLFLPAAKQMSQMSFLMNSTDFWHLRPQQSLLATQPGDAEPRRFLAATATETKGLELVYVPEERAVNLSLSELPPAPAATWFSPCTGQVATAIGVVGNRTLQFPTPAAGDWVLVIKAK